MKKKFYKTLEQLPSKFLLFICLLISISYVNFGQNIYGPEGVNWLSKNQNPVKYTQPINNGDNVYNVLKYRKVSTNVFNPSDGRGQWFTTINSQASGGDVLNSNLAGGSDKGFYFTSGPDGGRANNYWNFSGVGQCALNGINGVQYNSGGNDMGINMSTPGYYTFVLKDVPYTGTGFYVGYTTNKPVTFTLKESNYNADGSATIIITLSGTPSTGERFYARYSTSNDFSSSGIVTASSSGTGTERTITIPAQAASTIVYYYILSTTMTTGNFNALSVADRSYALLNYLDNSGNNYSYTTPAILPPATTDYFRSKYSSGTWNIPSNWESSPDGITWYTSSSVPTNSASSITIQSGDTIDIAGATGIILNKTIINGVLKLSDQGFTLFDGGGTDELTINSGGVLLCNTSVGSRTYGSAIVYGSSGNINVKSGGKIQIGDGSVTLTASGWSGFASDPVSKVIWNDGAIFEWNAPAVDISKGISYFPGAAVGVKPIFRLTNSLISITGAGSPTTFNGIFEVNMNYSFPGGGSKFFRDGIRGNGTLTQNGSGAFNLGAGAIIDGSFGIVTLNNIVLSTSTSIPAGANISVSGLQGFSNGGTNTLTIDGTLDLNTLSISNSLTSTVIINGVFKTSNTGGFTGPGSSIPSGTVTLGNNSTVEYYAVSDQIISTPPNYYNITFKGGRKTFSSMSSVNVNTLGTVKISGPDVIVDASVNNLGLVTPNTTNFIMDGGRLIVGTTGLQPNMGGTYTLTGGVIEFANPSPTGQTIRNVTYQNIDVTGKYVAKSSGYLYLDANGILKVVKNKGELSINNTPSISALGATTGQKIIVESGAKIITSNTGGLYGSDGSGGIYSAIFNNIPVSNIILDPNSTIEFNATGMLGNQTTNAQGINFGNIILSGTGQKYFYGIVAVKGNIINTSNFTLNSTPKGNLFLSGTADQTISGIGNSYLYTMEINKASGMVYLQNTINQIDNHLTFTNGKLDIGTGARLNLSNGADFTVGGGDFNSGSTGEFVFRGKSTIDGAGTINFYPKVLLSPPSAVGGVNFGPRSIVHNLLQLNTNSYIDINSPTFTSTSLLQYNSGGNYDRKVEWSQPSGNGFPYNVQVSGSTLLIPAKSDGSFQNTIFNIAGNLSIDFNSSIRMDFGIAPGPVAGMKIPLIVGNDLLIQGDLYASIQPGGDIKVNKNWTRGNNGKFFPNDRAVFFIGSPNSILTVTAPERRETFPYLILDKDAKSKLLSLNDSITITKIFTFTKGSMQLNNADATFQSDKNNTAYLTQLDAANSAIDYNGTGRFTVERYMPVPKKAWHLLSVPTKGSTFKASWQEGSIVENSDPKPGYGVGITSNLASSGAMKGFDAISTLPSVKYFDISAQDYIGIANTGDNYVEPGYFVFVRGDRSVISPSQPPKVTTLRTKGKIFSPGTEAPLVIAIAAGKFAVVGNPYPSQIKFDQVPIAKRVNLTNFYYVWDPQLAGEFQTGAFRTLTSDGLLSAPMDPTDPPYPSLIQSGQAIFVQATASAGSMEFTESAKTPGSDLRVFSFAKKAGTEKPPQIRGNIYSTNGGTHILLDGVLTQFGAGHSNDLDADDAEKLSIVTESMGIRRNDKIIVIGRRAMPLETDTIFYDFKQLKYQDYELQLIADEMESTAMTPFLKDKYLNTDQKLEAGINTINIKIENITGSKAADRFYIYFKSANTAPVTLVSLNAVEKKGDVIVVWKVENEKDMLNYTVELSADGNRFSSGGVVASQNVNAGVYQWTDVSVSNGYHYYRLKMTGKDGKISYSSIVKVLIGNGVGKSLIAIYPNPILNNEIRIQLENQPAGLYKAKLLNSAGQFILSANIEHSGGSSIQLLPVKNKLSAGIYHLEIYRIGEKVFAGKMVVQ